MSETNFKVGIYCRLSQEDGADESQSIKTQKEIILDYVRKQGWTLIDTYADDGYTGTNFNRPEFNRLINDIELGKINLVVTKDLSRLGRNYLQSGYYLEEFFPEHNVRYVAINDNYDSLDEDSYDFIPFKNIINEWYAKDISKKIRFTLEGKAKKGEPRNTVFPIFGYTYNQLYERVPDPETANIVRTIYKKFIEYASTSRVAKYLQEQNVYIPRFYNAVKYGYNKTKILSKPKDTYTAWTNWMVRDIIVKDAYLGIYKTAQTKGVSFKNKKRRKNNNCYVFEGRYQPLVDRKTWELANSLLKRSNSGTVLVEDNVYKGLLYCTDCGKPLRLERRKNSKKENYEYRYYCNNKQCKNCNSISRNILDKILFNEIKVFIKCLFINQEKIKFLNNEKGTISNNASDVLVAIEKAKKNCEKVDKKILFIIEQYAEGILPDSTYYVLMENCKKEKQLLDDEIAKLYTIKREDSTKNVQDKVDMQKIFSVKPDELHNYKFLQKLIKKICIKAERVNGSMHKRNLTLNIKYNIPIDIMSSVKYER